MRRPTMRKSILWEIVLCVGGGGESVFHVHLVRQSDPTVEMPSLIHPLKEVTFPGRT